ncbi:hypothetical protein BH11PLA1_BH11PLA1_24380 [soil metagenome]
MTNFPNDSRKKTMNAARGFTLVELLVVFIIIGIVMSILIPAVAGVRQTARKASTNALMKDLSTASNVFSNDRKSQIPGYFSPQDMGSQENGQAGAGRGMSGMQNVLLDLAGGIVTSEALNETGNVCDDIGGPSVVEVGPQATNTVRVNINLIGASTKDLSRGVDVKGYFVPDQKNFIRSCAANQRLGSVVGHHAMPELCDAWGNPILAWARDQRVTTRFAAIDSTGGPAQFYWNSNAAILRASSFGKGGKDHSVATGSLFSIIGGGMIDSNSNAVADTTNGSGIMAAMLGNPAFPVPNSTPLVPSTARGSLVFHSAGADDWFLSSEDKGGRAALAGGGPASVNLRYGGSEDTLQLFDDLMMSALN